jgi:prevent-host-death family protein
MNTWPVQDAKSRFSELLDACVNEGPQLVTRRGAETAVLIPIAEWKRLNNAARPSLKCESCISETIAKCWFDTALYTGEDF